MAKTVLISSSDPNLPFRVEDQTIRKDTHGNPLTASRSATNHFVVIGSQPVIYCEENGQRIWRLAKIPEEAMTTCVHLIKQLLESNRTPAILEINNQPALECKLSRVFLSHGFRADGQQLIPPEPTSPQSD